MSTDHDHGGKMTNKMRIYRIKKGVTPYSGRKFPGKPDSNGRTVTLYVDTAAAHKALGMGGDPRTYKLDEVTLIEDG
jgi:hypothetical protein